MKIGYLFLVTIVRTLPNMADPGYLEYLFDLNTLQIKKASLENVILFSVVSIDDYLDVFARKQLISILEEIRYKKGKMSYLEYIEIGIYWDIDWVKYIYINIEAILNLIVNNRDLEYEKNCFYTFKRKFLKIYDLRNQDYLQCTPKFKEIRNDSKVDRSQITASKMRKIFIFNNIYDNNIVNIYNILFEKLYNFFMGKNNHLNLNSKILILNLDYFEKDSTKYYDEISNYILPREIQSLKLALKITISRFEIEVSDRRIKKNEKINNFFTIEPDNNTEKCSLCVIKSENTIFSLEFKSDKNLQKEYINESLNLKTTFLNIKFISRYKKNTSFGIDFRVLLMLKTFDQDLVVRDLPIVYYFRSYFYNNVNKNKYYINSKAYLGEKLFKTTHHRFISDISKKNCLIPSINDIEDFNQRFSYKKNTKTIRFIEYLARNTYDFFLEPTFNEMKGIENKLCHWRKKIIIRTISSKTRNTLLEKIFLYKQIKLNLFSEMNFLFEHPDNVKVDIYTFSQSISQFIEEDDDKIRNDIFHKYKGHFFYSQQIKFIDEIQEMKFCDNEILEINNNLLFVINLSNNAKYHIFIMRKDSQEVNSSQCYDESLISKGLKDVIIEIFFGPNKINEGYLNDIIDKLNCYVEILKNRLHDYEFLGRVADLFFKEDLKDLIFPKDPNSANDEKRKTQLDNAISTNNNYTNQKKELFKCLINLMKKSIRNMEYNIYALANISVEINESIEIIKYLLR